MIGQGDSSGFLELGLSNQSLSRYLWVLAQKNSICQLSSTEIMEDQCSLNLNLRFQLATHSRHNSDLHISLVTSSVQTFRIETRMILSEEGPNNWSSESCQPVCVDLSLLDSVKFGFSCLTWLLSAFTIKLCLTALHFFPGTQKCKDSRRNETICTEDSFHAKSESFSCYTWVTWVSVNLCFRVGACSCFCHIDVSKQKESFMFQLKFHSVKSVGNLIFRKFQHRNVRCEVMWQRQISLQA